MLAVLMRRPLCLCRKVLTLKKEENQTFGFEIQVGEAGCRASEGLGGQSEEWVDPAPTQA